MKNIFPVIFCICFFIVPSSALHAQNNNVWKTLAKVTFKKQYDEFLGFKVDVPIFSEQVKKMEGKEVIVEGYIVPTEGYKSQKEFIFSAFPYNMCFFCGGAGPETIMEVRSVEGIEMTQNKIKLKGKLKLNEDDINSFMYHLEGAKLMSS